METKHTKGKWEAIGLSDNTYLIFGDSKEGKAEAVAEVKGNELMKNLANARLIAAAPEMLDFLHQITLKLGDAEGERKLTMAERFILEKAILIRKEAIIIK